MQSQTSLLLSPLSIGELSEAVSANVVTKISELILPATKNEVSKTSKQYLTRKQVAKLIGISLPTLHKYTITGKIPAYRIARQVRYIEDEVLSALGKIKTI